LKEEALDRTLWRSRFGRGYGPVTRQIIEWMNEWMNAWVNERMSEWMNGCVRHRRFSSFLSNGNTESFNITAQLTDKLQKNTDLR
jgi:hypothetical protein